jgi:hypothetical protein
LSFVILAVNAVPRNLKAIPIAITFFLVMSTLMMISGGQLNASAQSLKPTFTAISYWGLNSSQPLQASPGSSFLPLTVVIYYLGPVELFNITAYVKSSYPLTLVKGEPAPEAFVPLLEPGGSMRLVSLYNVSSNATPGVYNVTVNLTYYIEERLPTGETVTVKGTSSLPVEVAITGYSKVVVVGYSTYPEVLYASENAAILKIYLENEGNSLASNVTVKVEPQSPLSMLYPNMSTIKLGYLPPGHIVNLSVPLTIANVTQITSYSFGYFSVPKPLNATVYINVTYSGGYYLAPISLYLRPSAYFAAINAYHSPISVGASNVYVTVELANVGYGKAEYVTATLLPNPIFTPYVPSSENPLLAVDFMNESVGNLNSGEVQNVTFVISVSSGIRPGTYYLPLMLTWYQPPTMQAMHQIILVPVKVGAGFQLSMPSLSSSSNTILYVIAAVVIIILVAMAVVGTRRR